MERLVVIIVYLLLALIGLLGNIWVITTVLNQLLSGRQYAAQHAARFQQHQRAAQKSAFLYLLLLSVVDLISIGAVPLIAADIANSQWPFGLTACRLLFTCEGANKSLSPLVLMAMSLDRYMAVCRNSHHRLREWRVAATIAAGCIALSLLFILPVTLKASVTSLWDSNDQEHVKCTVMMTPVFDLFHTTICFILPVSAICCVYTAILRRLYRHKVEMKQKATRSTIPISRVVMSSVMVIAFYFICWTFYWAHRLVNMATKSQGEQLSHTSLAFLSDQTPMQTAAVADPMNLSSLLGEMDIIQLISLHDELIRREKASEGRTALTTLSTVPRQMPLQQPSANQGDMGAHQTRSLMLEMYLLHALPYCQCALNWLFYSFLNRNLRQQSGSSNKKQNGPKCKQVLPSVRFRDAAAMNGSMRRQSEPVLVVVAPSDSTETAEADMDSTAGRGLSSRKESRRAAKHLAPCMRKISRSTENLRLAITTNTDTTDDGTSGDEHSNGVSGAAIASASATHNPLSPLKELLLHPSRPTETPSVSLQSGSIIWL